MDMANDERGMVGGARAQRYFAVWASQGMMAMGISNCAGTIVAVLYWRGPRKVKSFSAVPRVRHRIAQEPQAVMTLSPGGILRPTGPLAHHFPSHRTPYAPPHIKNLSGTKMATKLCSTSKVTSYQVACGLSKSLCRTFCYNSADV